MEELQAETEEFRKGKCVTMMCKEKETVHLYAGNDCAQNVQ
jgi:hypothetical protein